MPTPYMELLNKAIKHKDTTFSYLSEAIAEDELMEVEIRQAYELDLITYEQCDELLKLMGR